ncbi:hypothetical protein COCVIDRAFT_86988 [Bipolaris victoriae FI3]|uniref:Uncharacterized protein n=2 Tax=Bipolaris TaxID=33194 RepID=W6YG05_COCC2|nr:uncharacterized protein COCCADRAFT_83226 [Bipolaris zeicola 26-R-13]XP_014561385.1 hypothetical protein COCVIDRAFT_86988 [Bipolaris victoriae FI3]EUC38412.1 hypothetical protein COCCADRAFT_83226 [Bipolaris zeicola 26-R-13]
MVAARVCGCGSWCLPQPWPRWRPSPPCPPRPAVWRTKYRASSESRLRAAPTARSASGPSARQIHGTAVRQWPSP